ncbi:WD repeat-containing protein 26 homolog isoform X1 [Malania oleifera]|uniref:WD repeat-containing protein 26 homolog isoform X1 n=1 Tax=Malania oleifera TaxID=397392 RepID=UPI0025ADB3A4|nr:WD repeat-containing protein 26 homolog isoform X1 [Malania oleifera]XP_057955683.1 WD repeat-containing protein 26 homolog isoform X1 [Malania oleifera]
MGGVEDDEPPSKRMKLSSGELKGLSNGLSLAEPVAGSLGDVMARPLPTQGDEEMVGSRGVIKRVEFVRIIAKALYSLGYKKSGAHLEEESGIPLHSSMVDLFMQQILDGNWDESVATLHRISPLDETILRSASFLIFEQKFFELLDGEKVMDALKTLRTEIAPLCINNTRIRELSSWIVSSSQSALVGSPSQAAVRAKSRSNLLEELQTLLPPTVMIPERRLEHLVEQALNLQRDACRFHNSLDREMSLYTDHQCGRDRLPSQTLQILEAHYDEVWFLQFSHKGKYLASSSNDRSAIIWESWEAFPFPIDCCAPSCSQVHCFPTALHYHTTTDLLSILGVMVERLKSSVGILPYEIDTNGVFLKHRLTGHQRPVSSVSWSPDDHQLLTCGVEESVRRWDVSSGECLHVYEKTGLGLVSCGWFPDGKCIFSGVTDKSICMWDLEGKELECWKGQRTLKISDLEITGDGKQIISICRDTAILLFERETKAERYIEEDQTITSFSLSRDSKFVLVSLLNQEIHLWNINGDIKLIAKYEGHKRARFIIRSCFGGSEEAFIASGSEDSQVYIWHRGSGELIQSLPGHSGAINCVCWNPTNPHMLASASDDRTVRVWGLGQINLSNKGTRCNGVHYCNGGTQS